MRKSTLIFLRWCHRLSRTYTLLSCKVDLWRLPLLALLMIIWIKNVRLTIWELIISLIRLRRISISITIEARTHTKEKRKEKTKPLLFKNSCLQQDPWWRKLLKKTSRYTLWTIDHLRVKEMLLNWNKLSSFPMKSYSFSQVKINNQQK